MCQVYRCLPSQLDGEDIERCLAQKALLDYASVHEAMHLKDRDSRPQEGPAVDLYYKVKEKLGEMVRAGEA